MKFILKGKLSGAFNNGCVLPVYNKFLKLYGMERPTSSGFHLPTRATLEEKNPFLLGVGSLDNHGNFEIELLHYQGGKIEVHWFCDDIPVYTGVIQIASPVFQFYIRIIQPKWVDDGVGNRVAEWHYTIPSPWFLDTLKLFDIGYICGKVKDYTTNKAVAGVTVTASGWEPGSAKPIGQAITDSQGRFVLFYPADLLEKRAWDCAPWPMEMEYYLKLSHQEARVELHTTQMGRPLTGFWNNPHMFDPQR